MLHETRRTTTLYLPNGFLAKFELAGICSCISKSCKSVSSCGQYFPFLAKWIMNYNCLCILWQYFIYVFPCFCAYSKNTGNFHSTIPLLKKKKRNNFEFLGLFLNSQVQVKFFSPKKINCNFFSGQKIRVESVSYWS